MTAQPCKRERALQKRTFHGITIARWLLLPFCSDEKVGVDRVEWSRWFPRASQDGWMEGLKNATDADALFVLDLIAERKEER